MVYIVAVTRNLIFDLSCSSVIKFSGLGFFVLVFWGFGVCLFLLGVCGLVFILFVSFFLVWLCFVVLLLVVLTARDYNYTEGLVYFCVGALSILFPSLGWAVIFAVRLTIVGFVLKHPL